jgi:N-acetylglucosamine-6-phosphate deacetylase
MPPSLLVRGLSGFGDLDSPSALLLDGGRIAAVGTDAERQGADAERVIDASGLAAVPGYIELQINGIDGLDFTSDPPSLARVGAAPARHGVTAYLPTIVTSPPGTVEAAAAAWRGTDVAAGHPVPLGLHVEGPYLSPRRAGAHDPTLLRAPDPDEIAAWVASGGLRLVTLAPELPGAIAAIEQLAGSGVIVSIGHTDADADTTMRAIDAGATYATHLFNAMSPLSHRAPGAPGALLRDDRVTVGLILDGLHLDPVVVELVARLAPGRVSLVSDAIAALGLADGAHSLAAATVEVRDGAARLPDGTLAGSVVGLDACVRAFAAITGSPRAAVEAVTLTPARLLGDAERGRLDVGGRADVVLVDPELAVRVTIVGGTVAFEAPA